MGLLGRADFTTYYYGLSTVLFVRYYHYKERDSLGRIDYNTLIANENEDSKMGKTVGKEDRAAVIKRDGACRACGLPDTLAHLLEADHIIPAKGRVPLKDLQCLCRFCNNAKNGTVGVPELPVREREFDMVKIAQNAAEFQIWLDNFRAPSKRLALRLAKREKVAKKLLASV